MGTAQAVGGLADAKSCRIGEHDDVIRGIALQKAFHQNGPAGVVGGRKVAHIEQFDGQGVRGDSCRSCVYRWIVRASITRLGRDM